MLILEDLILTDEFVDAVKQKHSEPHRHYHTWDGHISPMLQKFYLIRDEFSNPDAVVLAILFHDFVYEVYPDTYRKNEMLAATAMVQMLQKHFKWYTVSKNGRKNIKFAIKLIMATVKHNPYRNRATLDDNEINDVKLFLDLDLSILATENKYLLLWYEDAIRKEFSFYTDLVYNDGRAAVLRSFMNREGIFFSDGSSSKNLQAHANLAFLIQRLEQ